MKYRLPAIVLALALMFSFLLSPARASSSYSLEYLGTADDGIVVFYSLSGLPEGLYKIDIFGPGEIHFWLDSPIGVSYNEVSDELGIALISESDGVCAVRFDTPDGAGCVGGYGSFVTSPDDPRVDAPAPSYTLFSIMSESVELFEGLNPSEFSVVFTPFTVDVPIPYFWYEVDLEYLVSLNTLEDGRYRLSLEGYEPGVVTVDFDLKYEVDSDGACFFEHTVPASGEMPIIYFCLECSHYNQGTKLLFGFKDDAGVFYPYYPDWGILRIEPLSNNGDIITNTNDALSISIEWVGMVVDAFMSGPLLPLLLVLIVPIAVSAIFLGIKYFRRSAWGA